MASVSGLSAKNRIKARDLAGKRVVPLSNVIRGDCVLY
jgi:hypothetical protein